MARATKKLYQRYTVAIVGDGQTERLYFSDVRDTDRPANLFIFPDYPRKIGSYKGVLERAKLLVGDFDQIYVLIDYDKIIQDNRQTEYTQDKATAVALGIKVLENNPCFEIWLLLHFVYTGRLFTKCDEASNELKAKGRIPDYEKSEKFLKNVRLYKTYKALLIQQAMPNAKRLEKNSDGQDKLYPRAEIFRFFEWYLGNKC